MAKIVYQFADGHTEEVEVSEEFKTTYEELEKQEKRYYWKTNKQKQRAGLKRQDYSLEKCVEDGHEAKSAMPSPLDELIAREEQAVYYAKLLSPLTKRQKEVYVLRHVIGLSVAEYLDGSTCRKARCMTVWRALIEKRKGFFEKGPILPSFCPRIYRGIKTQKTKMEVIMIVKGKKLSKLLQERKLTRESFADKLGVNVSEVDKMLAGKAVGYETARKFVYFLTANCAQYYIDWQAMGKKNPLR